VDGEGDVGGVGVHLDGQSVQSVCERGGPVGALGSREILKRESGQTADECVQVTILPIEHSEWNTKVRVHPCQHGRLRKRPELSQDAGIDRSAGTRPYKGSGSGETSKERAMVTAQGMLVELLDLERIEVDIFRGRSPDENLQRVFGGQVAGQALVAAGRTVPPDRPVHSLHAYFIRPGDPDVPIVYTVDRIRDGRSFTTRRVVAVQHGRAIFALSASFQVAERGPEYQSLMPEAPDPETVPVWP
jgi:hypothetical protein